VQLNATGSVTFDLPSRPSGAGTAAVLSASGSSLATPTPTLDSVNTTLSASAAAGASSVTVTSTASIAVGRRYLVAGAETAGGEVVLVSAVAAGGTTITLARPLTTARASGATFQGTRVTVAITTASTAEACRQRRVEWTDPDTSDVVAVPFDVTRYAPRSFLTGSLLLDLDPLLRRRLGAGTWLPAIIERAWEMLLDDLGSKERHPGGYAGVIELATPHAYLVRSLIAETDTTPEGTAYRDDMRARYAQELERALASLAYDAAGTGAAAVGASQWRGIPVVRS
jgi:hypothetical protein